MRKILTLSVTALKEELYIAFMLFVLKLIDNFDVLGEKFAGLVDGFKAAYNHLNTVYLKYDLKFYTKEVQDKDNLRMKAFRKLRDMIRYGFTYSESEDVREAAGVLLEIVSLYGCGEISKKKMGERTAALTNLVEDYEGKYNSQVMTVGVEGLLAGLKEAQEDFLNAYMLRNEADAEIGLKAMADARLRMDAAYRDLVAIVNIAAKKDTEGELTDFINNMNVEIRKNFVYTGQSASSSSSGSAEDGDVVLPQKTATFKLADGRIEKVKAEVGAVLLAPQSTPGYHWKPEVPEVMPAKNTTYTEVENKRVKLTFHFLDHSEEEVEGLAGAALTAPQNTEGCVWKPAVPEVMPYEDTQYFETLVPEGGSEESDGSEDSDGSEEKPDTPPAGEEKPKYTVNWINKDGETVKTMQVEAGTKLTSSDYPKASSGYVWKPSWIGGGLTINGDTTIREELDDDLGV